MVMVAYCRWSSDDFQCDLYVYESAQGWECHVAGRKLDMAGVELPPPADLADFDAWLQRHNDVRGILDALRQQERWIDIPEPHGGKTYTFDSPGEMADYLDTLESAGLRFPDWLESALREEQADLDEAENQ